MKHISMYILLVLIIIITGCGDKAAVNLKQGAYQYKNSSVEITKGINEIDITVDSGNLQIYCWDKREIKFELKHTVRDYKTKEELEKQLKKFSTNTKELKNAFVFTVDYKGKIKSPQDIFTNIMITIPRRIKKINISQQLGNLIIEDKYQGDIVAKLNSVNSEIKSMKGQLIVECINGNLRLNSGKLTNESQVVIDSGSIYLKAECQEKSKYSFKTQVGNVELFFPVSSNIILESFGTVLNNQFTGIEGNIEIETSTEMGKISVNGY